MPGDNTTVHAVSFGLSVDTSKLQEGLAEAKVEIQQAVDEGTSKAADSAEKNAQEAAQAVAQQAQEAAQAAEEAARKVKEVVESSGAQAAGAAQAAGEQIGQSTGSKGAEIEAALSKIAGNIQGSIDTALAGIRDKVNQTADAMQGSLKEAQQNLSKTTEAMQKTVEQGVGESSKTLKTALTDIVTQIKKKGKEAEESVKENSEKAKGHLSGLFGGGITSLGKKAMAVLGAAFAVNKVAEFGKACINLGSDLEEVQNVVDVTFPAMSKQVDRFASAAISTYGISETLAKKYTGTFGSMAKAFGFTEEQSYDMSTALTGLAGDVASFYNLTQDEAYTKLKSVFTGETESLKDLGVVMTQTSLDNFALANGFGKTTAKMSEAEKVALRYKFVQEQLSAAQGDFARTSDGWANQVRVLQLRFDQLKATIGGGLIAAFRPVLKVINSVIERLNVLAVYFAAFTKALFGAGDAGEGAASKVADGASRAASSIANAVDAAKKAQNMSSGIDEMNIISPDTGSESGTGEAGAAGGTGGINFDFGNVGEDIELGGIDTSKAEEAAERIRKKIEELRRFIEENGESIKHTVAGVVSGILFSIGLLKLKKLTEDVQGIKAAFEKLLPIIKTFGGIVLIIAGVAAAVKSFLDMWNDGFSWAKELVMVLGLALAALGAIILGVSAPVALVVAGIIALIATIVIVIKEHWEEIKAFFSKIWGWIYDHIVEPIAEGFSKLGEKIGKIFKGCWIIVQAIWKAAGDFFEKFVAAPIRKVVEKLKKWYDETVAPIAAEFKKNVIDPIWNAIKKFGHWVASGIAWLINGIISIVEMAINGFFKIINLYLKLFNAIVTVAAKLTGNDWDGVDLIQEVHLKRVEIPEMDSGDTGENPGDGSSGRSGSGRSGAESTIKVAAYAQGQFVRANTPRLAIVGDNRHYGEVISPEDKMYEISHKAARDAIKSMGQEFLPYLKTIADNTGSTADYTADLTRKDLSVQIGDREIARANIRGQKRMGLQIITA